MADRAHVAENDASRNRLAALVAKLSDKELAHPMPAGWTVASVLGHVAYWDQRVVILLDAWQKAGIAVMPPKDNDASLDWINDAAKPLLLAMPPRTEATVAIQVAEAADRAVAALPDAFVEAAPGAGISLNRAHHRKEHLDEIEAALGKRS
jgi:uncharacterized damage-inducible protein DinB